MKEAVFLLAGLYNCGIIDELSMEDIEEHLKSSINTHNDTREFLLRNGFIETRSGKLIERGDYAN